MERSYTWGSPEGVQAVIGALPERYPMELITGDMEALIRALAYVGDSEACEGDGRSEEDHESGGGCFDTCWRMRAQSLLGSIAESVHVDWV